MAGRYLLAAALAAAVILAGLALLLTGGETGGGADPKDQIRQLNPEAQPNLEITTNSSRLGDDGTVVINVTVRNDGEARGNATLLARVAVDGGDTYTASKRVAVPAGESRRYSLRVDAPGVTGPDDYSYDVLFT